MLATMHAPAERVAPDIIEHQAASLPNARMMQVLVDAIPVSVIVLNRQRQIVLANGCFLSTLGVNDIGQVKGQRPGEALNCIHATETPGGCGTTDFCKTCGAVNAILKSHNGVKSVAECRILTRRNTALDLRVWAMPFPHDDHTYTLFTILDISDEKRRQALERIFFHDILNTAGVVYGLADVLRQEKDPNDAAEMATLMYRASNRLIEEIRAQRMLSAAERGDLTVSPETIDTAELLGEVVGAYASHQAAAERTLLIAEDAWAGRLVTDPVLLRRILGNMVKNALEATDPGGEVRISCADRERHVWFWVHNPAAMSPDVKRQIFQRSFSTKGRGRGIGSFSIKLLGETYLGGRVWFESSPEAGTTFFVSLPKIRTWEPARAR